MKANDLLKAVLRNSVDVVNMGTAKQFQGEKFQDFIERYFGSHSSKVECTDEKMTNYVPTFVNVEYLYLYSEPDGDDMLLDKNGRKIMPNYKLITDDQDIIYLYRID